MAEREDDRDALTRACLRSFEEEYPNWFHKFEFMDPMIMEVPVSRIVGSCNRALRYNPDWTPKSKDVKFNNLLPSMRSDGYVPNVHSPVTLFQVGDEYFVSDDGNRRVSIAHILGIRSIQARVTKLVPKV